MQGSRITMVAPRGRGALHPLLIGMCVGTVVPPHWQPAGRGPGVGRGGEMSGAKCKFMLTSGAENMFCATQGTLIFHKVK